MKHLTLKIFIIEAVICFALYGCNVQTSKYALCMNSNWHINLPSENARLYEESTGVSFTGDGIRYHILQYDKNDIDTISKSFDWKNDALPDDLANKANQWLDQINIPTEKRPETAKCKYVSLTRDPKKPDCLIMFLNEDTNELYAIEFFL